MKSISLLRLLIVIIIIIGGVIIIIIGRGPIPEPECIVCGGNLVRLLAISEVVLGAIALGTLAKITAQAKVNQRRQF
jgi:hypothetical protein